MKLTFFYASHSLTATARGSRAFLTLSSATTSRSFLRSTLGPPSSSISTFKASILAIHRSRSLAITTPHITQKIQANNLSQSTYRSVWMPKTAMTKDTAKTLEPLSCASKSTWMNPSFPPVIDFFSQHPHSKCCRLPDDTLNATRGRPPLLLWWRLDKENEWRAGHGESHFSTSLRPIWLISTLNALFPNTFKKVLRCVQSTLFFIVCGGANIKSGVKDQLQDYAQSYIILSSSYHPAQPIWHHTRGVFDTIFSFPAVNLQPHVLWLFAANLFECLFLEHQSLTHGVPCFLQDYPHLGLHTNLDIFEKKQMTHYWWAQCCISPYGIWVPFTCPRCHCLESIHVHFRSGTLKFWCSAELDDGKCEWSDHPTILKGCHISKGLGPNWMEGCWFSSLIKY